VGEKAIYTLKGYTMTDSAGLAVSGERLSVKAMEIPSHEVHSDATGNPVKSIVFHINSGLFHKTYLHKHSLYNGIGTKMTFQVK